METKVFLKTVGSKIRAVRKSKGLSQERLAELSGLHPTHVSDVENGKSNASISSYHMIAKALGVPMSDILSIQSGKHDRKIEAEVAEVLGLFRQLDKKKQGIWIAGAKGLAQGIEKS